MKMRYQMPFQAVLIIFPNCYAFIKADNENLSWILLIQEDRVRLYNTRNISWKKE